MTNYGTKGNEPNSTSLKLDWKRVAFSLIISQIICSAHISLLILYKVSFILCAIHNILRLGLHTRNTRSVGSDKISLFLLCSFRSIRIFAIYWMLRKL